ncbi:collagen alpha-1(XI) chain-like [Diadema antillarum]|uniref:collagen alpha-1(XI) chain-like n=1 Tax=Diadema antillarum TaxID=105358 RepID=UPI003A864A59
MEVRTIVIFLLAIFGIKSGTLHSGSSQAASSAEFEGQRRGERAAAELQDGVDLLAELRLRAPKTGKIKEVVAENGCLSYKFKPKGSIKVPTPNVVGASFPESFSVLINMQYGQEDLSDIVTVVDGNNNILLRLRMGLTLFEVQLRINILRSYRFVEERFADDKWHQVGVGVNRNQIRVYMDCEEIASLPTKAGQSRLDLSTAGNFVVGGNFMETDVPFRGEMQNLIFVDNFKTSKDCSFVYPCHGQEITTLKFLIKNMTRM